MSDTFCSLLWRHLATETSGNVKPCCISQLTLKKEDDTPFNYGHDDVDAIFNSDALNELRRLSLQGEHVPGCDECYATESFGGFSNRMLYNSMSNVDVDNPKLNYLDLRLGNKCNLACMSCSPESSSMLEKELGQELNVNTWYTTDTFQHNIDSKLEQVKAYYITGGEPTIIRENEAILNKLVEAGRTDIHITINTNLASYSSRFYRLLAKFKSVGINISVDGTELLQEYLRYPSKWQVIDRNLQKVLELGTYVIANPVIQLSNLNKCVELLDYFESFNRIAGKQVIKIYPIDLIYPEQLNFVHLPKEFKIECWQRIEKWLSESNQYNPELEQKLSSIKNKCYADSDYGVEEYKNYTRNFDESRGMSLRVANPELAELLNI